MRTTEQHLLAAASRYVISECCEHAFLAYRSLIGSGIPRELARGVLPLNTYTHMFATVDLHNLFHFLKLRLHEHSQYEIRVYAGADRAGERGGVQGAHAVTNGQPTILLDLPEVERRIGKKKSWIYASSTFPKPIKVGSRNRWIEQEIERYIQTLKAVRDMPRPA